MPRRAARVAPAALATAAGGASRRALRRAAGATASAKATAAAAAAPAQPRVVNVPLGDRSYPIYIGPGLLDDGARLRQHIPGSTALLVTNETIAPLYLKRCALLLARAPPRPACARNGVVPRHEPDASCVAAALLRPCRATGACAW